MIILTKEETLFLYNFFKEENSNINGKNMNNCENLLEYIKKYKEYLINSELKDNPVLKLFLKELYWSYKINRVYNKQPKKYDNTNYKIHNGQVVYMIKPSYKSRNLIIDKWTIITNNHLAAQKKNLIQV